MHSFSIAFSVVNGCSEHFSFLFFFCSDPKMDDDESSDGSFSTRFSASRLREVAEKELNANKRAVLEKSSFGSLLKIRPFSVPLELIDWVVMRIDTKHSLFRYLQITLWPISFCVCLCCNVLYLELHSNVLRPQI